MKNLIREMAANNVRQCVIARACGVSAAYVHKVLNPEKARRRARNYYMKNCKKIKEATRKWREQRRKGGA